MMSHAVTCSGESSCINSNCRCWCHTHGSVRRPVIMPPVTPLVIPLSNDGKTVREAHVLLPRPLTEAEWAQFHKVLRRMKPALVEPKPEVGDSE